MMKNLTAQQHQYQFGTQANRIFMANQTKELLQFASTFPAPIGGAGWLNDDGSLDPAHGIHTWITSRMTHVYAIGEMLGHPGSAQLVERGLDGLLGPLHDKTHGGWYPQVSWNGTPAPDKICYTHAFVILAASSALLAGHERAKQLLEDALATFDQHFWNDEIGLTVDTWDTSFSKLDPYRGINANMHTTEAFLAVADATGDEQYRKRAGRIIEHVIAWASNNHWRIPEHFNDQWQADLEYNADKKDDQFKPYGATPGHGIEWSRLITQWAHSYYPNDCAERREAVSAAEHLFNQALQDGWCADGQPGIVYTTDWSGKPIVHDRMHWTLAEAINTAAVLYRTTGNKQYADWYETFCQYLDESVIDHEHGSWFHQLDNNNCRLDTVWPGKSDAYHAFQATLIPFLNPAISIASAIYRDNQFSE